MSAETAVQVESLSMRYPGARQRMALMDANFSVSPGETFGIIGQNGAGKTTLLKILSGLLSPTSGRVRIAGLDPRTPRARARLGFLPETPRVYPDLTVLETMSIQAVLYPGTVRGATLRIRVITELLGLKPHIHTRVDHCSKGTVQRLAIAALLVPDPQILILDEPFSGLDPSVRHRFNKIIANLQSEGRTIILCAHELPEVARHCGRVAVLHGGRIGAVAARGDFKNADALERLYLDITRGESS